MSKFASEDPRRIAEEQILSMKILFPQVTETQREFLEFLNQYTNAADRSLMIGHFTASAWIVSRDRGQTLLTHHRKLGLWIPLGGHCDGDFDLRAVAMKEAEEESGLTSLNFLLNEPIFAGKHPISEHGGVPAHHHYDVRFLLEADETEPLVKAEAESLDLKWVLPQEVSLLTKEQSLIDLSRSVHSFF